MLWLLSVAALAAPPDVDPDRPSRPGRDTRVQYVDFDRVNVYGETVKPDVKYLAEHQRPVFNPLVHLRENWDPEMLASVDQVK